MLVPRRPYTDVFCPNCGDFLFRFDPNSLFAPSCVYGQWDRFIKKHGKCWKCGFRPEKIDKDIFMCYYGNNYSETAALNYAITCKMNEAADVIGEKVKRYKLNYYPEAKKC